MDRFALTHVMVSLAALAMTWYFGFRPLQKDEFRTRIRRIRDDLFDFMWLNGLDYREPAYVETRQILNGILRASNLLSMSSLIAALVFLRDSGEEVDAEIRDAHSQDLKNHLTTAHDNAMRTVFLHVFRDGPVGWFVARPIGCVLGVMHLYGRVRAWFDNRVQNLVELFIEAGDPNPSPGIRRLLRMAR